MKKGFTLVELLAVIVIIALTSTIVFPAIGSVIMQSKQDLYNNQILDIKAASEKWATENSELLDNYHVNDVYITLELLRSTGYLEVDAIKNPLTREDMHGCIQIKYDKNDKKYKYAYEEQSEDEETNSPCIIFASSSSTNKGYIIYSYNNNKKEITKNDTNKNESIGQYLTEIENIHAPGEIVPGLYESDDEYVYKGYSDDYGVVNEPKNYITFKYKDDNGNEKNIAARILSISKKDYSIKIIETIPTDDKWSDSSINFKESTINTTLIDHATTNKIIDSDKVIEYDFQIGKIDNIDLSISALKSILNNRLETNEEENGKLTILSTNTVSQKVGTISVLDYVNASASLECQSNFKSSTCQNNNYLTTMFRNKNKTIWTLNNNGNNIWYIKNDGFLALSDNSDNRIDLNKNIYPVYKLSSDVFITNDETADGSVTKPYIIK